MKDFYSTVRDVVRTQLWPLPTAAVFVAVVAAFVVPRIDRRVDAALPGWLSAALFSGDAGAASTLLNAISSSLISVTALTFSLTVVTLQLASSQFSPRLLRTFASDLFVQATLALFLGTFAFSLTVLRSVRSSAQTSDQFVPRMAVTLAFVLAIASVFGLVLFLAHLTSQIRVETMLRNVHDEASSTLRAVLEERDTEQPKTETLGVLPHAPERALTLRAHASGFLTSIDLNPLLRCASEHGVLLVVEANLGSFLVRHSVIARAWAPEGGDLAEDVGLALQGALDEHAHLGDERTAGQDVGFGLRQLTDVANKALSPGINDPTTAIHALGHISALLCDLADRRLGPIQLRDDDGDVRLLIQRPTFAELVEGAITQPRRYGASDPQVAARLGSLLGDLAERAPRQHHYVVAQHLRRLRATIDAQDFDETEQLLLADLLARVEQMLPNHDDATERR